MECLIGIGTSIVAKIGECTVPLVGSHLGYCFYYKTNIEILKTEVEQLKMAKQRIQHQVDDATKNLEEIEADVQDWLFRVRDTTEVVEKFIAEREAQLANMRCHNSLCPNLLSRYKLGKKARRTSQVIVELRVAGAFDAVSYRLSQQSDFEDKGFKDFETRKKTLTSIMEALRDPKIRLIGVHGMAGVGKTMLAKDVARQAKKLFCVVVMVTVSQDPNWKNIQEEIADPLGLKELKEKTGIVARADVLKCALRKEKEVLLILDDLWKKVDLQDVGISFGDDQEKCKILFTSRSQELLRDDMGIENNFSIEVLSDNEAKHLFTEIVGDLKGKSELQTLATQLVKECAGLPLAIGTIASALKNKGLYEWRNALTELTRSTFTNIDGMEEKVYKSIKFSYDFVQSEEAQSLFLLCSMREEDANIHLYSLLIEAIGLGLFQNVYTLEETIWRLHALINKLKARYLLLEGDYYWSFKMHDVVRDVGISIASKDRRMYNIGSNLELEQCLKKKQLEGSTAISLQYDGVNSLPEVLNCDQLQLLLMPKRKRSPIPDRLFEVMKNLGHADLSESNLKPIPSSFTYLENLQSLILNRCKVGDIAIIGELKCLEALSFRESDIDLLPEQIGQLTHLRLLDLNSCSKLEVIHPNVIPKLTRLEELNMLETFINWEVEGFSGERNNARLTDLKNLVQLRALHLHVPPTHNLPKSLFKEALERFFILIEDHDCDWPRDKLKTEAIFCTRSLKLGLKSSHLVEELGLRTLLKRSEELHLDGVDGLNNVIFQLDSEGFPQLKHLVFQNNNGIKYIIDLMYQSISPCSVLQCLESLRLKSMLKLEKICRGKLELETFGKLRVVEVDDCGELRDVFSASVAKLLLQLEEIVVKNCKMMKVIVTDDDDGQSVCNDIIFPKIKSLRLEYVPELQQFYGLNSSEGTIPTFFDDKLLASSSFFQRLTKLMIVGCDSLKYLFSSSAPLNLVQLKALEIKQCRMMEEIIKTNQAMDKVLFPHLTFLWLQNLPNLTFVFNDNVTFPSLQTMIIEKIEKVEKIWQTPSTLDSCSKLEEIEVVSCKNLRKMLSSSMLRRFQNLRRLRIYKCEMLEEVFEMIQNSNVEEGVSDHVTAIPLTHLNLKDLPNLKHVWSRDPNETVTFQNLERIYTKNCPSLQNLFPVSIAKGLHQLEILVVKDCGIQEIVAKEDGLETRVIISTDEFTNNISFPKLNCLKLRDLPKLSRLCSGISVDLPSLTELIIDGCRELKTALANSKSTNIIDEQYVAIPNLKKIKLRNMDCLKLIWQDQLIAPASFSKLEDITIDNCENLMKLFPCMGRLPSLIQLDIRSWHLLVEVASLWEVKDINDELKISDDHQGRSLQFKCLKLFGCERLKRLGPPSMSFENLRILAVVKCHALFNLLTPRTARSLTQLTGILVAECEKMREIIAADETDEAGEICFTRMKELVLDSLPNLSTFCSGNYSMRFPNLKIAMVNGCPEMTSFSGQVTTNSKLKWLATPNIEKGNTSYVEKLYDRTEYETRDDEDTESEDEDEDSLDDEYLWVKFTGGDLIATIQELWKNQLEDMGVPLQKLFAEKNTDVCEEDSNSDSDSDSD